MIKKLNKISSEIKFVNPYWEYCFDNYVMPNGENGEYHWVNSSGSTMIIPQLDDGNYIMTKQYRYLNGRESIEFPGGGIKQGLSPLQNAIEELREEAGYDSSNLVGLGCFNPFNGVTNEMCWVFLAQSLTEYKSKPDVSEEFEIIKMNSNQIISNIKEGQIWDGMTLAAFSQYFFHYLVKA